MHNSELFLEFFNQRNYPVVGILIHNQNFEIVVGLNRKGFEQAAKFPFATKRGDDERESDRLTAIVSIEFFRQRQD